MHARTTYSVNPQNPNELTFACLAYTTRALYVKDVPGGSQVTGDAAYGLR